MLSILLSTVCVMAEGDTQDTQYCGKDITWEIDDNGIMTIEGSGEITSAPWRDDQDRCDAVRELIVKGEISSIPYRAFYGCTNLAKVHIYDGLKVVEEDAFFNCTSLSELLLPDSLESLMDRSFGNCTSLKGVEIPKGVRTDISDSSVSKGPFAGSGLERIEFAADETVIPSRVCEDCNSLTEVVLPDTLITIENRAFYNCVNLSNIVLPKSLKTIGSGCFSNCIKLTRINIPAELNIDGNYGSPFSGSGLTDIDFDENTKVIADDLFYGCKSITNIEIPSTITRIGADAFENCTGITNLKLNEGLEYIGEGAFSGCKGITSLTIPETVTFAGKAAFGLPNLTFIRIPKLFNQETGAAAFSGSGLQTISIDSDIEKISDYMFDGCYSLRSIEIPDKVCYIGKDSFGGCKNLETIKLPSAVKEIGSGAFQYCDKLAIVELNEGLIKIGYEAFLSCKSLCELKLPDSLEVLGGKALTGCSIEHINIPRLMNQKEDNTNPFRYCPIKTVEFDNEIKTIPEGMFSECTSLEYIKLPENAEIINSYAFYNCSNLTDVVLNENIREIKACAFRYCEKLENINLPESLETISSESFYGCKNLKRVTIPQLEDGHRSFVGSGLETIEFSDNVKSIPAWMFEDCDEIKNVVIPEGVTKIDAYAFSKCDSLKSVTLPKSITYLGNDLFSDCANLSTLIVRFAPLNCTAWAFSSYSGDIYFTKTDPYWDRETRLEWAPNASWRNKDCVLLDASYKTVVTGSHAETQLDTKDTWDVIEEIKTNKPEEVEVKAVAAEEENGIVTTTVEMPKEIVRVASTVGASFTYTTNVGEINLDSESVKGALSADASRIRLNFDNNTAESDPLEVKYDVQLINLDSQENETNVVDLDNVATLRVDTPVLSEENDALKVFYIDESGSYTPVGNTVNNKNTCTFSITSLGSVAVNYKDLKYATITYVNPSSFIYSGSACKFRTVTVCIRKQKINDKVDFSYSNNVKAGNKAALLTVKGKKGTGVTNSLTHRYTIKIKKPGTPKVTVGKKKITIKMSNSVGSTGGTQYVYQYRKSGTSTWKIANKGTTKKSVTVSKLKKGAKYQVRVYAKKTNCSNGPSSKVVTSSKVK